MARIINCSTDPASGWKEPMAASRPARLLVVAASLALLAGAGCGGVNRRFVIESNVPNAQVYVNNRAIGAAPAHASFEYYGYYNIELVHPDYQRETHRVQVRAPWYGYPPFDFLAEVIWPFKVDDVRRYNFELKPAVRTDTGELIVNAENLRERGLNLPVPEQPAEPRRREDGPTIPPASPLPPPTPVPPSVIPSVTP